MIYFFFVLVCLLLGAECTSKRRSHADVVSTRQQKARAADSTETRTVHDQILHVMASNLNANVDQLTALMGEEEEVEKVYSEVWQHARLSICMYLELKKTTIIGDIYAECGVRNYYPVILYRWLQFVVSVGEDPIVLHNGLVQMTPAQMTRMINGWNSTFEEDGWSALQSTVWMMMARGKPRKEIYSDLTTMGFAGPRRQIDDMWDNTRKKGRMDLCVHQALLVHPEITSVYQMQELCPDVGTKTISRRDVAYWREITDGQDVIVVHGNVATMNDEQFNRLLRRLVENATLSASTSSSSAPTASIRTVSVLATSYSPDSSTSTSTVVLDTADEEAAEFEFIWNEVFGAGAYEDEHLNRK